MNYKNNLSKICCLTCDVEIFEHLDIDKMYEILNVLGKKEISCTLFLLIQRENFDDVRTIYRDLKPYEVGLHIHWGERSGIKKGLRNIDINSLVNELKTSKILINKLGIDPVSFRGGGLSCDNRTLSLIKRYGFKYDSSVAPKLDEKGGWFQNHKKVPYLPLYLPSKRNYYEPAKSKEEALGILEVPVTRSIPAGREWYPYTLTPVTPIYKFIINEWIVYSRLLNIPTLITPIFHSWGEHKFRGDRFPAFLARLEEFIEYLLNKGFRFIEIREIGDALELDLDDEI